MNRKVPNPPSDSPKPPAPPAPPKSEQLNLTDEEIDMLVCLNNALLSANMAIRSPRMDVDVRNAEVVEYIRDVCDNKTRLILLRIGGRMRAKNRSRGCDAIEDGHGSAWSAWCPECGEKTMHVVRPGKAQCGVCG